MTCRINYIVLPFVLCLALSPGFAQDIVGGKDVAPDKYPFMVGILSESFNQDLVSSLTCGGSIIDENWVLTAGHCVEGYSPDELWILVDNYDLTKPSEGKKVRVAEIILHPDYHRINNDPNEVAEHDVALLRLETSVDQKVVKIPAQDNNDYEIDRLECQIMGWGVFDFTNPAKAKNLKEANVFLIDREICKEYDQYEIVSEHMICAGQLKNGNAQGGASGDSGGPLVIEFEKGKWLQLGVMSWGKGYTRYEAPGVYQRVASYSSWIIETVGHDFISSTANFLEGAITVKNHLDFVEIKSTQSIEDIIIQIADINGQVLWREKQTLQANTPFYLIERPESISVNVLSLFAGQHNKSFIIRQ